MTAIIEYFITSLHEKFLSLLESVLDFFMKFQMMDLILGIIMCLLFGVTPNLLMFMQQGVLSSDYLQNVRTLSPVTNYYLHFAVWFMAGFYTRTFFNSLSALSESSVVKILNAIEKSVTMMAVIEESGVLNLGCIFMLPIRFFVKYIFFIIRFILIIFEIAVPITILAVPLASPFFAYITFVAFLLFFCPYMCGLNWQNPFILPHAAAPWVLICLMVLLVAIKVRTNVINWVNGVPRLSKKHDIKFKKNHFV